MASAAINALQKFVSISFLHNFFSDYWLKHYLSEKMDNDDGGVNPVTIIIINLRKKITETRIEPTIPCPVSYRLSCTGLSCGRWRKRIF